MVLALGVVDHVGGVDCLSLAVRVSTVCVVDCLDKAKGKEGHKKKERDKEKKEIRKERKDKEKEEEKSKNKIK